MRIDLLDLSTLGDPPRFASAHDDGDDGARCPECGEELELGFCHECGYNENDSGGDGFADDECDHED